MKFFISAVFATAFLQMPSIAAGGGSNIERENSIAHTQVFRKLSTNYTCSAKEKDFSMKLLDSHKLPARLRLEDLALSQMMLRLKIANYRGLRPNEQEAMLDAAILAEDAEDLGITPSELRDAYTTGSLAGTEPPVFMSTPAAHIALENGIPQKCGKDCELNFAWNVVLAASVWKALCVSCTDDFLSIISVGGYFWIDTRIQKWALQRASRPSLIFPLSGKRNQILAMPDTGKAIAQIESGAAAQKIRDSVGEAIAKMYAGHENDKKISPPQIPVYTPPKTTASDPEDGRTYSRIAIGGAEAVALCNSELDLASPPRALQEIRYAVCGVKRPANDPQLAKMTVSLVAGSTSCGPSSIFIGCAKVDNAVELTLDNVGYSIFDMQNGSETVLGDPLSDRFVGSAVLLHEIGHWFGIPHIDYEPDRLPDVMQGTYQARPCITTISGNLVNNMAAKNYLGRLKQGAGLRRPK